MKKIISCILVMALLLSIPVSVNAQSKRADELITGIINYFQYYQGKARLDYDHLLEQLSAEDPALGKIWSGILDFWIYLNEGMDVSQSVLPEGLPEDDSLCIAVMGYYLKSDGTMRDELYARLKVALASAEKYPNAYILCTGGGSGQTEAGQMSRWLIKQGISKDRIIVEDRATSTIENAQYGCAMLYRDYPQVKYLAVITSDYHIYRSSLYFSTQSALDAYELGTEPMQVLAAATCRIKPNSPSDIDTQVEGMCILTQLEALDLPRPELSKLEAIRITGTEECMAGSEPELFVSAEYSNGYTREITQDVTFSGLDFGASGVQTVTASYEEGGIHKTASMDILFLPSPEPVTEAPSAPSVPEETLPPAAAEVPDGPDVTVPVIIALSCAALLCILLILKKRQAKKRRRPKPTIKLD